MVNILSQEDRAAIGKAIEELEAHTSAEIVTVMAPISDAYQGHVLLFGLALGSVAAGGLWLGRIVTAFPFLLATQVVTMALCALLPPLRSWCIRRVVPSYLLRLRAAHRAYGEYLHISQYVSATTPIVLLYVSLTERYAHILTSRNVREHIPEKEWDAVITDFATTAQRKGLREASINAVRAIAQRVTPHFPKGNAASTPLANVIEVGCS